MSLSVKRLTNGDKEVITVRNAGVDPPIFEIFNCREDVDVSIRHYVPDKATYVSLNLALSNGVADVLYPGYPMCCLLEYEGKPCIGDACKHSRFSAPNECLADCPLIGTDKEFIPNAVLSDGC